MSESEDKSNGEELVGTVNVMPSDPKQLASVIAQSILGHVEYDEGRGRVRYSDRESVIDILTPPHNCQIAVMELKEREEYTDEEIAELIESYKKRRE